MDKMVFKVGDIVECIDCGNYNALTIGEHYTVLLSGLDGIGITDHNQMEYYNYRFKLATVLMNSDEYDDIIASQEAMESVNR
jgi:hypothetical protein